MEYEDDENEKKSGLGINLERMPQYYTVSSLFRSDSNTSTATEYSSPIAYERESNQSVSREWVNDHRES